MHHHYESWLKLWSNLLQFWPSNFHYTLSLQCINGICNPSELKVSVSTKSTCINEIYKFFCVASFAYFFFSFLYCKAHLGFLTKSFWWQHAVESAKLSKQSSCDSPSVPIYCHNLGHQWHHLTVCDITPWITRLVKAVVGVTGSICHVSAMFTLNFNSENAAKISPCTYRSIWNFFQLYKSCLLLTLIFKFSLSVK